MVEQGRIRTLDLLRATQALSLMSYGLVVLLLQALGRESMRPPSLGQIPCRRP